MTDTKRPMSEVRWIAAVVVAIVSGAVIGWITGSVVSSVWVGAAIGLFVLALGGTGSRSERGDDGSV